jgi:hypothetical protein
LKSMLHSYRLNMSPQRIQAPGIALRLQACREQD